MAHPGQLKPPNDPGVNTTLSRKGAKPEKARRKPGPCTRPALAPLRLCVIRFFTGPADRDARRAVGACVSIRPANVEAAGTCLRFLESDGLHRSPEIGPDIVGRRARPADGTANVEAAFSRARPVDGTANVEAVFSRARPVHGRANVEAAFRRAQTVDRTMPGSSPPRRKPLRSRVVISAPMPTLVD